MKSISKRKIVARLAVLGAAAVAIGGGSLYAAANASAGVGAGVAKPHCWYEKDIYRDGDVVRGYNFHTCDPGGLEANIDSAPQYISFEWSNDNGTTWHGFNGAHGTFQHPCTPYVWLRSPQVGPKIIKC